jgi:transposase
MNNDITELIKFVGLQYYDIDVSKTTIHILSENSMTIIHMYLNRRNLECRFCHSFRTVTKETRVKEINHPILPQHKITIFFHQRKILCKECNHTFMENNPLTSYGQHITNDGLIKVLNSLRNPRKTFQDAANDYFISKQTVINYFDRYVQLNRHQLTKIICFDEVYAKKLTKTKYSFCIFDPISNTLLDLVDARLKNVLEEYFIHIPIKERLKVEYVNIDMWQTYVDIAERYLPNATICVDSFHVIEHLNNAMRQIRLKVQRRFVKDKNSDRNGYYWLLKTFHYYLVENIDNIKYIRKPRSHYGYLQDKYAVLNKLLSIDENLKAAYYLKERYRDFNLTEEYNETSLEDLEGFIEEFKKSKYEEFREFGCMLEHWKFYIVNSFIRVNGKRMSNGPIESLNGRLKRLLDDGYGYTDFTRFRNRAMFSLNRHEPIKNYNII